MAAKQEEKLSEAVRKFPVLYDKSDRFFKDRSKKRLAWEDVANEVNLENGEIHPALSMLYYYISKTNSVSFFR